VGPVKNIGRASKISTFNLHVSIGRLKLCIETHRLHWRSCIHCSSHLQTQYRVWKSIQSQETETWHYVPLKNHLVI